MKINDSKKYLKTYVNFWRFKLRSRHVTEKAPKHNRDIISDIISGQDAVV